MRNRQIVRMCAAVCSISTVVGSAGAAPGGDTYQRSSVPRDGMIRIADYGYRDWGPELVHYELDPSVFPAGELALLDEDGAAVPFQIENGVLSFVASVSRGGTSVYQLRRSDTDRSGENTTLEAGPAGGDYVIANQHLSVRLPGLGEHVYADPVPARQAPPPMLQWRQGEGDWMGVARLATERRLRSCSFNLLREGPAVVEYEARYLFDGGGVYLFRIQLSPGVPVARITEEFDFGEREERPGWLLLDLHAGWRPDRLALVPGAGEQQMPQARVSGFADYLRNKRSASAPDIPVGGVGQPPRPVPPAPGLLFLEDHVPAGKWGGKMGDLQVWAGDEDAPGDGRNIGITLLHAGAWRRANALHTWYDEEAGLVVSLPLGVRPMRWSIDMADDFSPFSTHEHDPGLPETYGRRQWGLMVGNGIATAQARYGYIGLDRYKDWTLEWPDTAGTEAYPGGFFDAGHVQRIRDTLAGHPDADTLRKRYLFSGETQDAIRQANAVIEGLKRPYQENDFFIVGLTNYRKSQMLTFVNEAEDALACPALPGDLRTELRRRLALYAYVTSEPDWNPRGAGVHLGNNNMTINRTLALTYFAALLPDHPMHGYWMERAREFARFKFATQTAPCGAWVACPTYQLYSPTRTLNIALIAMRNRGITDFAEESWHAATLEYLAHLTMPDPRFGGKRILPGMGNSANQVENIWGFAMAAVEHRDPRQAGWFRYLNRLTSGGAIDRSPNHHDNRTPHPLYFLPDIPEHPRELGTAVIPGYGVAFRNRFGQPDETAMLFRTGIAWSHWDTDSLNVILYGRGVPLSPGTGYQYIGGAITQDTGIYHNRVKVGERDAQVVFGRVDAALADYGMGDSVDYARADHYYPPEIFRANLGEQHWRRHVMFLKRVETAGVDYFVMRDTFDGEQDADTWWTWLNLETADRIAVDGEAFTVEEAPLNKVVPVDAMPVKTGQTVLMKTDFGVGTHFWFDRPRQVRLRLTAEYATHDGRGRETKTLVEIPGSAGEDVFCLIWPLADGEAAPAARALAPGVMRIETGRSVDYVFIGDGPFDWEDAEITFSGRAGAVRIMENRVILSMNAGSGRIGYRGHVVEGHGPFEREIPLAELAPGIHRLDGGYGKADREIQLGDGIVVRGEGPFEARLEGERIIIETAGRARVLHVTQPAFITRPAYSLNGREWMACWTDYPASGWGAFTNTWQIALSVPEGENHLVVEDMRFPHGWQRPFRPAIEGVVHE